MFKSIVNAVINSNSVAAKVVGYTALAVVGIGADIVGASAKKVETKVAPATEKVADEDIVVEVIHDEDTVMEVVHDEDTNDEYDDSDDRKAEDELFEAAIKSTSNSFVLACEEAIETKAHDEEAAVAMEEMAKLYLNYLHINLGKEEECLAVHNAREALAAFRAFGPSRIEWM